MNKNDGELMEEYFLSIIKNLKEMKFDGCRYYVKNNITYFKVSPHGPDSFSVDVDYYNITRYFGHFDNRGNYELLNLNKFDVENSLFHHKTFNIKYREMVYFLNKMFKKYFSFGEDVQITYRSILDARIF